HPTTPPQAPSGDPPGNREPASLKWEQVCTTDITETVLGTRTPHRAARRQPVAHLPPSVTPHTPPAPVRPRWEHLGAPLSGCAGSRARSPRGSRPRGTSRRRRRRRRVG